MSENREVSAADKSKLDALKSLLSEQEDKLVNENKGVSRERETARERVSEMFEKLQKSLVEKEVTVLQKIDTDYSEAVRFLDDLVRGVKSEKQKVSELLTDFRDCTSDGDVLDIAAFKSDIEASLELRRDVIDQFRPPYLVLNERSIETVKELNVAELKGSSARVTNRTQPLNTATASAECARGETVPDSVNQTSATGFTETPKDHVEDNQYSKKRLEAGQTTQVSRHVLTPSAPSFSEEESPPSYWQAVAEAQGETENRNPRLPKNSLEMWHVFSTLRQHGRRLPVPIALTWNCGKICVVDKANEKVEFFYPNGDPITEMVFEGTMLRDVAFLDEAYGVTRYVLTTIRSRILTMISVDGKDNARVFRKLSVSAQYICICRGPRPQTLVGAEVSPQTNTPCVVSLFTFTGQVLLLITHTPSYVLWQYIKSVEVFGSNIIILDWKMNLVAVYRDDGSAVGEYCGTEQSPLINPSDMTLDNNGNILILNGGLQNIHVTDLCCRPLQIIDIPKDMSPSSAARLRHVLIAFDLETQRLCVARNNGDIAVFAFKDSYDCIPQVRVAPHLLVPHQNLTNNRHRSPEILPLIEGMLPSTVEAVVKRQHQN